jgi:hypothetical protein
MGVSVGSSDIGVKNVRSGDCPGVSRLRVTTCGVRSPPVISLSVDASPAPLVGDLTGELVRSTTGILDWEGFGSSL